jgi:flagellar protein FlaG
MTINPRQSTAPIGDLSSPRADRWASEELRRKPAAAPPSHRVRAAKAEEVAEVEGQKVPEVDESTLPEPSVRQLAIRKDPEIDRVVVQVIDGKTGEVVRQIPSEEWVRHLKRLKGAKGLFVDQKG